MTNSRLDTGTSQKNQVIIDAYGSWMDELQDDGYDPYFLTIMFSHIRGSEISVQKAMLEAAEKIYSTSLTHIFRHPKSAANRDRLPRWLVCPDYPIAKYFKSTVCDVTINQGRHLHAIAMVPSVSRLKVRFDLHLLKKQHMYVRSPVMRLAAEPIKSNLGYVTGYGLKALKTSRVDFDDLIIFPRSIGQFNRDE